MRHAPQRLGPKAREICGDVHSDLLLSLVSGQEMAIKLSTGKLRLPQPLKQILVEARTLNGISTLPIDEKHVIRVQHLPLHHRDPFDRLLAAQAVEEGLTLLSRDASFDAYSVRRVSQQVSLTQITDDLITDLGGLSFGPPVTHVYNPLIYARSAWDLYCERFGQETREVLMVGMNPGPWGMSQVGVPFGEIASVRDWMGIETAIGKPDPEHPKRPILGFACPRSEVSGRRLWSWAKSTYDTPEAFFARFFVANYSPLVFMEDSGRNRIPEKLPKAEREPMYTACDRALRRTVQLFEPKFVIGIGKFAEKKARQVVGDLDVIIGSVPHPSPASPLANRGWAPLMDRALAEIGVL